MPLQKSLQVLSNLISTLLFPGFHIQVEVDPPVEQVENTALVTAT